MVEVKGESAERSGWFGGLVSWFGFIGFRFDGSR